MNDAMISVIIPVYNVEDYVEECIQSLLSQTYTNFEMIIVDDGSTDSSGDICDRYSQIDQRIKIIHKENSGPSSARNAGLDLVCGDYICFVDSDDTVKCNYLEKLLNTIVKYKADMVICDAETSRLGDPEYATLEETSLNQSQAWEWLSDNVSREYTLMVVVWNKIFSKKIFTNLRFPTEKIHEDDYMINQLLIRAEQIIFLPDKLYMYRYNASGITGSENISDIRHMDFVDAYCERIRIAIEDNRLDFASRTLRNGLIKLMHYYKMGDDIAFASRKEYKKMFINYHIVLSIKQQLKYGFFVFCPQLAIFVDKHFFHMT